MLASTHENEEEQLLPIIKNLLLQIKNLKIIIAPRHIERSDSILKLFNKNNIISKIIDENNEVFNYILIYYPYDNVKCTEYPAMLVLAGLNDSQVQFWEPAKWVALLRSKNIGNEPLLLKTNMESGHSGSSGRYEKYKEIAFEYAFLLRVVGY